MSHLERAERHPRSSAYQPDWLLSLDMGPHPLWQLEDLLDGIELSPDARVLDLGPGRGATTVFLVREFGCSVTSFDHWITTDERRGVLEGAGVAERVELLDGDVRTFDFGDQRFDAVISVDAFEYFGTDVWLLPRLVEILEPGGLLAMSTPALRDDPYDAGIPAYVRSVVGWEATAWHSPAWWARHWELPGLLADVNVRWQVGGHDDWMRWEHARLEAAGETSSAMLTMLDVDAGEQLGFVLATARRPAAQS